MTVTMDDLVTWYVDVLFHNIFLVPEPLMEFAKDDDDMQHVTKAVLLRFLIRSRLAEEKSTPNGTAEFLASKKLVRKSKWLISGLKPTRKTDEYMWDLTRGAMRVLLEVNRVGVVGIGWEQDSLKIH